MIEEENESVVSHWLFDTKRNKKCVKEERDDNRFFYFHLVEMRPRGNGGNVAFVYNDVTFRLRRRP